MAAPEEAPTVMISRPIIPLQKKKIRLCTAESRGHIDRATLNSAKSPPLTLLLENSFLAFHSLQNPYFSGKKKKKTIFLLIDKAFMYSV